MKTIILVTKENLSEYPINKIDCWQDIKHNVEKFAGIDTAYIYFTERGIRRKINILQSSDRIVFQIIDKLSRGISLTDLRNRKVVAMESDMRGKIQYLDEDGSLILGKLWTEYLGYEDDK